MRQAAEQDIRRAERVDGLETEIGPPSKMGMRARDRLSRHALRGRLRHFDVLVAEQQAQELSARISRRA
jgi:hypothetical protein